MECMYCGTENPSGSLFCKKCGRRLDGMALCPSCGNLTPADGEFCVNCGSNRNAPVIPRPKPAEVNPAQLYSVRGDAVSSRSVREKKAHTPAADVRPVSRREVILGYAADACAAFAALVAVVFVFLIGTSISVGTGSVSAGTNVGNDIFYYFGGVYDEISALITSNGVSDSSVYAYALTTGAVLTTMVSAAAMAATAVCFILTVIRYIKRLLRKTDKGVFGLSVATFISYISGVALFFMCVAQRSEIASVVTYLGANSATVAGIVLGAIAVVAAMAMNAVIKAHSCGARSLVLNGVGGGLIAAFALVAIGVASGGYFGYGVSANGVGTSVSYGIYSFMESVATGSLSDDRNYVDMFNGEQAIIIIMVFVAIIFAALAVCALVSLLDLAAVKSRRTLVFTYSAGACGIVLGVLQLVSSSIYSDWLSVSATLSVTVPVVIMVFSALMIIGAGVYTVLSRKYAAEPVAAEA